MSKDPDDDEILDDDGIEVPEDAEDFEPDEAIED